MNLEEQNRVRLRIVSLYNKRAEEFASSKEHNDYLEEVEDIVFNLCNRIDVAATEARVAAYSAANADSIAANRVRLAEEQRRLESAALAPPDSYQAAVVHDGKPSAPPPTAPPLLAMPPAVPQPLQAPTAQPARGGRVDAAHQRERQRQAAIAGGLTPTLLHRRAVVDAVGSFT